jgi:hypothetical protein
MGERSLPARQGGEVRGLETLQVECGRVSGKQRGWEPAPLPTGLTAGGTPPILSGGGRDACRRTPPPFARGERNGTSPYSPHPSGGERLGPPGSPTGDK